MTASTANYLVIDPQDRSAVVFTRLGAPAQTLREDDELDGGDLLPGFRLPLREILP